MEYHQDKKNKKVIKRIGGGINLFKHWKPNVEKYGKVLIAFILLITAFCMAGFEMLNIVTKPTLLGYNANYERVADPNTMDDYMEVFNLAKNSRAAGRVWSDKTVFANGYQSNQFVNNILTLDRDTDGVNGTVQSDTDFLHVFSTIGSSQVVDEVATKPIDVVMLLDISRSMTTATDQENDPLHQLMREANTLINRLMNNDEAYPVHPNNRVGIVVYGGGSQQLLPLGHYTAKSDNNYISIGDRTPQTGSDPNQTTYFASINTNVNGYENSSRVMVGDSTYLQGALYEGMSMLASEEETTYHDNITDSEQPRTPVVIVLTDGATNIVSASSTSHSSTQYQWYQPVSGVIANDGGHYVAAGINPFYADCNENTGKGDASLDASERNSAANKNIEIQAIAPRTVSNLLLAGYYQNKIQSHYNTDMLGFSIGFNVGGLGDYANEQLLATLDPRTYFGDRTNIPFPESGLGEQERTDARNAIEEYIEGSNPEMRFPRNNDETYRYVGTRRIYANFTWNHPADTENDVDSFEDVYYIDKYYTAGSGELSEIFNQIFEQITGTTFSPVAGENASGVSDSLTYMDPIGEYMEVKDKSIILNGETFDLGLTLFGEMHGLVKTAIYDFQWNDTYMKNMNGGTGGQLFKPGWFRGTPELTNSIEGNNSVEEELEKPLPDGCANATQAWEEGWVYRIPWDTAVKYVSTLNADSFENITDTQKNTVYTIYRFDKNITTGEVEDTNYRNTERLNPCYEKSADVKYLLSDIRVWVEDTGNYQGTGDGSMIDSGFDQALYVNIPANALPLQVAKISLDADGNVSKYETNIADIADKNQSTPFRLYYGVGVQDEIMTDDGLDIDVPRLDNEYITEHSQPTADGRGSEIYFLSNYYSNTVYTGYVTNGRDTYQRGDPNFTFSPSTDNRYYAFTKPLILYQYEGTPDEDDNTNFYEERVLDTEDAYQKFITEHEGKEVKTRGEILQNNYYWIVGEYYQATEDGKGKLVHFAVTRKGGEFGSEIAGEDVSYSDYLVWYNPKTNDIQKFDRSQDGPGGDYVVATKVGGLRVGNMLNGRLQKSENTTSTSHNYYIPTISEQSTGNNIIINGYLGNNGKLVIPNTTLEITKEVNSISGDDYSDEEFNYVLQIEGRTGDFSAVNMIRSPFADNLWQLRLNTIDVITDNEGLLQQVVEMEGSGHSHSLYKQNIGGINYYVYVGGDGSNAVDTIAMDGLESEDDPYSFRLYDANDTNYETLEGVGRTNYVTNPGDYTSSDKIKYVQATRDKPAGTMEFWIADAYLIPATEVDGGDWHFELPNSYGKVGSPIVVSTLNPYEHGKDQLTSEFATDSMYGTTTLYFGYGEVPSDISKPDGMSDADWAWLTALENKNKTRFTLKDGEGIFLAGLDERTNYTVYEMITEDQMANGYNFGRVYGSNGQDLTYKNPSTGEYTEGGYFRGSKDVHFVNLYRAHYDLVLDKTVLGTDGDTDKEWNFTIKLTPVEGEELETTFYYYGKCESIDDACVEQGKKELTFTKQDDGSYTANISLKHNEKIKLINIPSDTAYEISEQEANQDGYETYEKTGEGYYDTSKEHMFHYDTSTGIFDWDRQVGFFNAKWKTYDLTVRKTVTGALGDKTKEFTFKITLTPGENARLASQYPYDGSKEGNLQLTPLEDGSGSYTGTITLKDQESITIHGIPENTQYLVEEVEKDQDDYITTVPDNASGTLTDDQTFEVNFVNTKYSRHTLTLEKIVRGGLGDKNKEWQFEITLKFADDVDETITDKTYHYKGSSIVEGVAAPVDGEITFESQGDHTYKGTISLKHGQSITIENIPEKTEYTITEVEANQDSYTTRDSGNTHGLVDGQTVRFTNINLAAIDLTVEKEVTGESADTTRDWNFEITLIPASDVTLASSYEFEGNSTIPEVPAPVGGTLNFVDNHNGTYTATITLKHGQSITIHGLPETTKYTVVEKEANQDGYFTSSTDNRTGILDEDDMGDGVTVKFTNELLPSDSLTIGKEVRGTDEDLNRDWTFQIKLTPSLEHQNDFATEYHYTGRTSLEGITPPSDGNLTFVLQEDGSYLATITLKHGQAITIEEIPVNTLFEVAELEANTDDFTTSTNRAVTGTIGEDNVASIISFTNAKTIYYNLTLNKTVTGALGETDKEWNFNIRLTPAEYAVIPEKYSYVGTKNGELQFVRQSDGSYLASITLKHNDEITIQNIPENTSYQIEEQEANQDGYLTLVVGSESGILLRDTTVRYENIRLGSFDLTVKKHVKGILGELTRDFTFKITLTPPEHFDLQTSYEGTKAIVNYVNNEKMIEELPFTLYLNKNAQGNYEGFVTLKDSETFTVRGLPEGTTYAVNEIEANQNGYITDYTNNIYGTIYDNGTTVEYTNYRYRTVNLTIEKILRGNDVEKDREWTFEVTLKSDEELPLNGKFPYQKNNQEDGIIEFTKDIDGFYKGVVILRGGEKVTIKNLPYEIEYAVREVEANKERYKTSVTNENGTLNKEETEVIVINERDEKNPPTGDNILAYVTLASLSSLGMMGTVVVRKKVNK